MDRDSTINKSTVISGSTIKRSNVSNTTSEKGSQVTAEMWSTLGRLAEAYGKQGEIERVRELKSLLDEGKRSEAKPVWQKIRAFIQDFANVSQIIYTIDLLTR